MDAFFVNTDEVHYGGTVSDIEDAAKSPEGQAVPLIYKDFIIHPIQVDCRHSRARSWVLYIIIVLRFRSC